MKINQSLKKGIEGYGNREDSGESLLHIERDEKGNIKYIEPDTMVINRLVLDFSTGVKENYSLDDIQVTKVNLGVVTGSKFLFMADMRLFCCSVCHVRPVRINFCCSNLLVSTNFIIVSGAFLYVGSIFKLESSRITKQSVTACFTGR